MERSARIAHSFRATLGDLHELWLVITLSGVLARDMALQSLGCSRRLPASISRRPA